MQSLHDGDARFAAGLVDGGRNQHKGVVNVDEVGRVPSDEFENIALAVFGVDDVFDEQHLA